MIRLIIKCQLTINLLYCISVAENHHDYFTIFERMQVTYLNNTFLKGIPTMKVTKYNRTSWVVNLSAHLLKDIDGRKLQDTSSIDILLSSTYKFTGVQLKANACEIYEENQGGVRTFFEKYSNINLCNLKKGHLYISNGLLEEWWFPDNVKIPYANFRITFDISFLTEEKLMQLQLFIKSNKYVRQMGKKHRF